MAFAANRPTGTFLSTIAQWGAFFMKFEALASPADDPSLLQEEYKQAREIGKLRLGQKHL